MRKLFFITSLIILAIGYSAKASTTDFIYEATQSFMEPQKIIPEDLGIKNSKILPDSKFHFIKLWLENFDIWLTKNEEKKAEKLMQKANRRLYETKQLAEKNSSELIIKKSLNKYISEAKKAHNYINKMKDNSFVQKIVQEEFVRQRIINSLYPRLDQKTIDDYKNESMSQIKGIILSKSDETANEIKKYVEKNIGLDQKSVQDLKLLEKIKEFVQDKDLQKKYQEIKEYAINKIYGGFKDLKSGGKGQEMVKFLAEDSSPSSTKNIVEKIIEEKEKIEKELRKK